MFDYFAELSFTDLVASPVTATTLAILAVLYALWLIVRRSRYSALGYAGGWIAVFGAAGFALAIALFTVGDGTFSSAPVAERAPSMSRDDGGAAAPRGASSAPATRPSPPGTSTGSGTGDIGGGPSTAGDGASKAGEEGEPAPRPKRRKMAEPADSVLAPAEAEPEPFETVQVFFGTDRAEKPTEREGVMSVGFGSERGRRLTLGGANVTVPTAAHQAGEVERPWEIVVLGVTLYREEEDPAKHFTIAGIETMSKEVFVERVNAKLAGSQRYEGHAIVFVHGYNVAFDAALYRTAQIAYDMGFDGAPFLYSWPSNGSLGSYESDQNNSEQAERYLREFIDLVMQRTNARHVSFIAHSMGNKPLLKVLKEMQITAEVRSDLKVNQIILAAPDIDRDVFADLVEEVAPIGQGVTLYASNNDRAMVASRAYAGGIPRAGDISELGPVLEQGLDTIDVSAQSTAVLALNHSTYAEKSDLLADIGRLILEGVRPPRQRTPALEERELDRHIYWRFPPTGN